MGFWSRGNASDADLRDIKKNRARTAAHGERQRGKREWDDKRIWPGGKAKTDEEVRKPGIFG